MMQSFENNLLFFVSKFNEYLSNYVLILLLCSVGIFYTIKTRFVQVRFFFDGIKYIIKGQKIKDDKESITPFQALSTAVAAQVGTGNIVGAAGAILIGGPGAIFWMWCIAFFGMATIYAEATLAIKTRKVDEAGNIFGGPVYYIKEAFKGKLGTFLSRFFAVAIILALGFMGSMVQSNSIAYCMNNAFHIPNWCVGITLVLICIFIFIGGVKRLASTVEKLVPCMAFLFISGSFAVLFMRIQYLPEAFSLIFKYAFYPQAILGGSFFYAIKQALSQGVKRGLFSNEAGMGSTPHAHALANVPNPHIQGTIAMLGVFIDTIVILTLCALAVISTFYVSGGILEHGFTGEVTTILNRTNLVQKAFEQIFGGTIGSAFVAICLFFFAFSTILSWNLFGKINALYLFQNNKKVTTIIYTIISICFIMMGALVSSDFVWELADMFNNIMVLPNVLALFALNKLVVSIVKDRKNNQSESRD